MDMKSIESIWSAWQEVQEKKKMDPVDKSELKGKHADRDDKDIDNDGDVDSSDEYLHNRRKAVSKAVKKDDVKEGELPPALKKAAEKKKGKKDDDEEDSDEKEVEESSCKTRKENDDEEEGEKEECPKCKGKGCEHCDDKGYHMKEYVTKEGNRRRVAGGDGRKNKSVSENPAAVMGAKKMKESALFSEEELAAIEERAGTQGPAPAPAEEFMSTSSPNDKKIYKDHEAGSDKKLEDYEEIGELDAAKAGKGGPSQSSPRRGDNLKVGDNAMPTPTKAKGQ